MALICNYHAPASQTPRPLHASQLIRSNTYYIQITIGNGREVYTLMLMILVVEGVVIGLGASAFVWYEAQQVRVKALMACTCVIPRTAWL